MVELIDLELRRCLSVSSYAHGGRKNQRKIAEFSHTECTKIAVLLIVVLEFIKCGLPVSDSKVNKLATAIVSIP